MRQSSSMTIVIAGFAFFLYAGRHAAPAGVAPAPPEQPSIAKFDRIPVRTLREMTDPSKSVGTPGLSWPVNVVTVAFNGGDPQVYPLIETTASEWTAQGGRLAFSFRRPDGSYRTWRESDTVPAADIRIGFLTDGETGGYWSAVGTLSRKVPASEETMNLGDLGTTLAAYYGGARNSEWRASYSHGVVLHEFGHALGLHHEHFHPQCQSDLNLQAAVTYLMGPPNGWTRDQAMFNLDAGTYFKLMNEQTNSLPLSMSPNIDQASVMLYYFPIMYYKSGARSPCKPSGAAGYDASLSPQDRRYYLANYPGTH